ncbi:MAG: FKBP-type peptidyl-prolyl cis-trans isomerase [Saprospiraceae bacterium]|nr:FKBP-type peptidyl-prolyl cis-trans isomerase [Saprospiraceae bacterium]
MNLKVLILGCACWCLGLITVHAQAEKDIDRFSYSYGLILGNSFKKQGLDLENISLEDLKKGIEAAMAGKDILIDPDVATEEVQAKLRQLPIENEQKFFADYKKRENIKSTTSGILYEIIQEGTGDVATQNDRVDLNYQGTLVDGTVFETNAGAQPMHKMVGGLMEAQQEIVKMMPAGSKWKVYIPSNLAYGARGHAQKRIPPHATLIYELEVISVKKL